MPPFNLPNFSPRPGGTPIIGQQEQQAKVSLMQALTQFSSAIYTQLAVAYIATLDRPHQAIDPEHLEQLAQDAYMAAKAYFEGLGIAQFKDAPPKPANAAKQEGFDV